MTTDRCETPLALRPAREGDREFLFALMKAALGPHVVARFRAWDEASQRTSFFERLERTLAEHQLVELAGEAIGCLHARRDAGEIRLCRVFLLPSHQGAGRGTSLMRALMQEADAARLPIRLRVLRANPARRLYERLGFAMMGADDTHFRMERAPGAREAAAR